MWFIFFLFCALTMWNIFSREHNVTITLLVGLPNTLEMTWWLKGWDFMQTMSFDVRTCLSSSSQPFLVPEGTDTDMWSFVMDFSPSIQCYIIHHDELCIHSSSEKFLENFTQENKAFWLNLTLNTLSSSSWFPPHLLKFVSSCSLLSQIC